MNTLDTTLQVTPAPLPVDATPVLEERLDRLEFRVRLLIVFSACLFGLWALEHILR